MSGLLSVALPHSNASCVSGEVEGWMALTDANLLFLSGRDNEVYLFIYFFYTLGALSGTAYEEGRERILHGCS